jgi:hypothetical protein
VWASVVGLALLVCLVMLRPAVDLAGGIRLLRPRRGIRESSAGVVLLSSVTGLVVALLVATTLGVQDSGALRGAGTLLGPVNTLRPGSRCERSCS